MTFKSNRQRKGFFARQENTRSSTQPEMIKKKPRFLTNKEWIDRLRRTKGGRVSDFE